ncbi:MAG: hypothetical protein MI810_01890 [Flavobacteriales bacterium]|nr:hypothetical protein [Flavobacteriales bacterium]
MKRYSYLLIFCISLFSKFSFSQDYLHYFKEVARAEVDILDSNYSQAIKTYDELFRNYDFVFPKDALVAAQVAAFEKDAERCIEFLKIGVKNGLPPSSIMRNPHFYRLSNSTDQNTPDWTETTFFDSLVYLNKQRINQQYRDTIIEMVKEDQYLRDKNETFLNAVIFNHKLKPRLYKKWMAQAHQQAHTVLEFTKEYGFPSHKVIGTHRSEDYSKFGTNYSSSYATIILYHYDFAWQILKEELPEQLKKGNINPKQYALLRDFATRHYLFGKVEDEAYSDYHYFVRWTHNETKLNDEKREDRKQWIEENKTAIDLSRDSIGLLPYDYGIKMRFNQWGFNRNRDSLKTTPLPYFDFNYWGWD